MKIIRLFKEAIRVLKDGGVFAIHDVIFHRKELRNIEKFRETIKLWKVRSVEYLSTIDILGLSNILKPLHKGMGLVYGKK